MGERRGLDRGARVWNALAWGVRLVRVRCLNLGRVMSMGHAGVRVRIGPARGVWGTGIRV